MECERLIRLIKDWYIRVKQETMAPARMMQFIDKHVKECEICRSEVGLAEEIEKIRGYVLPDSKIPKAEREQEEESTPEISPDDEDTDKFIDDDDDEAVNIEIDDES